MYFKAERGKHEDNVNQYINIIIKTSRFKSIKKQKYPKQTTYRETPKFFTTLSRRQPIRHNIHLVGNVNTAISRGVVASLTVGSDRAASPSPRVADFKTRQTGAGHMSPITLWEPCQPDTDARGLRTGLIHASHPLSRRRYWGIILKGRFGELLPE